MAKRTRWVQFDVPLFVRVEIDAEEEYEGEITKVVLAIPPAATDLEGIELARGYERRCRVYDGDPDGGMAEVHDDLAEQAVTLAEYRRDWPPRSEWEEDSDPRKEIGLYDDLDEHDAGAGGDVSAAADQ